MKTMFSNLRPSFKEDMMAAIRSIAASSSKGQLLARRDALYEARRGLKDPGMKRLCRAMIAVLDGEMLARAAAIEEDRKSSS